MSGSRSAFDRFADWTADRVASAVFFVLCVVLVAAWAPSLPLWGSVDTWQLVINTATTILTFLMLALLHNSQHRFEAATNARLEEIVEKLEGAADPVDDEGQKTRG